MVLSSLLTEDCDNLRDIVTCQTTNRFLFIKHASAFLAIEIQCPRSLSPIQLIVIISPQFQFSCSMFRNSRCFRLFRCFLDPLNMSWLLGFGLWMVAFPSIMLAYAIPLMSGFHGMSHWRLSMFGILMSSCHLFSSTSLAFTSVSSVSLSRLVVLGYPP